MSKKSDRIMAGILFGGAAVGVIAFACWRMNVNSYGRQKYVAMYFEESKAAEESKKESEKAEEEAFWAMPSVVELTLEQTSAMLPTEMPTASEVMTEMSLPTEALTECPTEPPTAPTTAIPATSAQIIVPTTEAPKIANIALTAEEENLLMRVASCEAGNQGWQGMALVMNVVLNRRAAWGMSISDVIYAKGQFSVIGCNKWNNGFIAAEAPIALQAVKDGWDGSQGALFFCAPSGRSQWMATRQYLFTAWGHEFYR